MIISYLFSVCITVNFFKPALHHIDQHWDYNRLFVDRSNSNWLCAQIELTFPTTHFLFHLLHIKSLKTIVEIWCGRFPKRISKALLGQMSFIPSVRILRDFERAKYATGLSAVPYLLLDLTKSRQRCMYVQCCRNSKCLALRKSFSCDFKFK